jgi:hypothetical protein
VQAFLDDIAALENLTGCGLDSWRKDVSVAGHSMADIAPGQTPAPHTSTGWAAKGTKGGRCGGASQTGQPLRKRRPLIRFTGRNPGPNRRPIIVVDG